MQIRGYDFHVLENYQSFVHNLIENMGVDVSDSWSTPCKSYTVKTYQPGGTTVKDTYALDLYERNVQIDAITSVDLPLLLTLLQQSLPEGVQLSVHEHAEEHYEARFIPDPFLDHIKKEIVQIQEEFDQTSEASAAKREEREERKRRSLLASLDDDEDDEDEDYED